jgi:hypothetical protein
VEGRDSRSRFSKWGGGRDFPALSETLARGVEGTPAIEQEGAKCVAGHFHAATGVLTDKAFKRLPLEDEEFMAL